MKTIKNAVAVTLAIGALMGSTAANAACGDVSRGAMKSALSNVVGTAGGFGLPMWLTFVDESGVVCEVVTSGESGALASRTEWLGSRVISAQKANTANAFSINGVSISTGALMAATQPGGSLFGLQEANPVDAEAAYKGPASNFGTHNDPMKGERVGGTNVFGGGIAVYKYGKKIGAFGVSGDTSCTDHATVWAVRKQLGLDPNLADFPTQGGFERLHITTPDQFANLGDHADCYNTTNIKGNAAFGFK
jgi:uncharacterized protein GlcG (DUF336 family)